MSYPLKEPILWTPPIALTPEEQTSATRPRKTRKFLVFLREHRHERLDLGLVLAEVARWPQWLEPQHTLAAQVPPMKESMDTSTQSNTQDTAPDPDGGPGGRRMTPHVTPDRRLSLDDAAMRHGRKSSAKTFNGFKEPLVVDLESTVMREVMVRPANAPEHAVGDLLAETLEHAPGLRQLDIDMGYMASPRSRPWGELQAARHSSCNVVEYCR
jgi:hypothetical protein